MALEENSRKPRWTGEDWFLAVFVTTVVVWLLITVVPAFFDGRVAQAVR